MDLELSFANEVSAAVRPTPTSLDFVSEPTKPEWLRLLRTLAAAESGAQWWLGDALAFGERKWGETYQEASEATGKTVGTLQNLASVSRKVPPADRIAGLSHNCHRAVMGLDPDGQRLWLGRAFAFRWGSTELRRQMALALDAAEKPEAGTPPKPPRGVEYVCPKCGYGWDGSPVPPGFER